MLYVQRLCLKSGLWAGVEYEKRRISKRRICVVLKRSVGRKSVCA